MAIMSTAPAAFGGASRKTGPARKIGVFRIILEAIMESRRRKAEIEIAEFFRRRSEAPPHRF